MQVAENEICGAGNDNARLCYTEYNVAAPRFYRARGYTEAGRSPEWLSCGIVREVIVMEKKLKS